jgi:hypothetical protein
MYSQRRESMPMTLDELSPEALEALEVLPPSPCKNVE